MAIRTVVWGENVHEQTSKEVRAIYPDGMHAAIAAGLASDKDIKVSTATLQEPPSTGCPRSGWRAQTCCSRGAMPPMAT